MVGKYSTGKVFGAIQNEAYWMKIVDNSTRTLQVLNLWLFQSL
ncbi:hypothetical protein MCEKH37_01066 [Methylophilaceae bacterium]